MKKIMLSLSLLCFASMGFSQDFKLPAPSPTTTIKQDFSTSFIELTYSRPSVKERKIFGQLIPYDKMWRTGANAATAITFNEPIKWGNDMISPGSYSIVTIPGEDTWVVMLYKGTDSWGINGLSATDIVAKTEARVKKLDQLQETFEISFQNITNSTMDLVLQWEYTQVKVRVEADNFEKILGYLEHELKKDNAPYLEAARFYLEHDYKLDEALGFTEKALKARPDAFWIQWTKAQILSKLGKHKEAKAAALIAVEKTRGTSYENEYKHHYESLK